MSIGLEQKFIPNTAQTSIKIFEEDGGVIASEPIPEYYRLIANNIEKNTIKTWTLPVDSIPEIIYAYDPANQGNANFTIQVLNATGTVLWIMQLEYSQVEDISGLLFYKLPLAIINKGYRVTFTSTVDLSNFTAIMKRCHVLAELGSET